MKVNASLKAISNISTVQEVAANNVANVLTAGFKASRALQNGDSVTISQETRNAIQRNEAATASASGSTPEQDLIQMRQNQTSLSANITAIKTQNEMYKALDALK